MRNASSGLAADSVLVDTNIVVYAYDESEADKHGVANSLLLALLQDRRLVVSAQTLNEFYVVVTRPRRLGRFSYGQAVEAIRNLISVCEVVPVSEALTLRALEAMPRYSISFWDALIWAAARENGITTLLPKTSSTGRRSTESAFSTHS